MTVTVKLRTAAALVAAGALTLSGCSAGGGGDSDRNVVRIAVMGGQGDTLDVSSSQTMLPYEVGMNVLDSLVTLEGGEPTYQLATQITPDSTATRWTVRIRDDVTFHDGAPVRAADVLYSLRYISGNPSGSGYADVDFDASEVVDDHTLTLVTTRPRADFVEAVLSVLSVVFPEGTTDFTSTLIGSGPYKVTSFSPATGAVLEANRDYWGGAPSIPRLEIIPMAEDSARLSALTGGQVDYANGISATGAETVSGQDGFEVSDLGKSSAAAMSFTLNTSKAPFDDPEVVKAVKMSVDRQKLVDVVLRGYGEVGHDLVGSGLSGYSEEGDGTEPAFDPDAAEKIFRDRNVTGVDMVVSELAPGLTDASTLLKQQLADVGVTVNFVDADSTTLFSDLTPVHENQMLAIYYANRPASVTLPMFFTSDSPYNFSGWKDPEFDSLLTRAQAETDKDRRAALLNRAQEKLRTNGATVVWGYSPVLDAHVDGIGGVTGTQSVPLFGKATFTK